MRTLKRNTILSVLLNVGEICKDVFGATKSKRHGTSNKLVFDPKKIERLGKIYDISLEVKVKENGEDGDNGIDVGLDKHLRKGIESEETTISNDQIDENYKTEKVIPVEIALEKETKEH